MGFPHVLAAAPNVALIGGGFIGPVHAEALRRIGVPVVGLLGSGPKRAAPLAARLGITTVYRDLDDLLADERVGAVHIASPNAAHFEQTKRCLAAGKHVVCEKPLATTSAETTALVALANQHPRSAAAVNYNVRFYPLCLEMRDRVASGAIGRILSVTGSYTQDWLLLPTDYNWRVEGDAGSNLRAIGDIGTHWMDLAQFVVGSKITDVCADLAIFHRERLRPRGAIETFSGGGNSEGVPVAVRTEDYGAVLLHFENEARGVFHVTQMLPGRKNRLTLEIAGTEGSLAWDSESPETLWLGRRGGPNEVLLRDPALLSEPAAAASHYPGGHAEGFPDSFKQLALAVYQWIASDAKDPPPFPTFADGDYELRLCEAIAASAEDRSWTSVCAIAR